MKQGQRPNSKEASERFGFNVVKFSRANLTRQRKNVSRQLYDSLEYEFSEGPNSFSLAILMEEYGMCQDQGVRGAQESRRAPRSPYKFGTGTAPRNQFKKNIDNWITRRGIKGRDALGRFITKESLSYLIRRSIYNKGLRPSYFITKPFEAAFKKLPEELTEAYALDIIDFMDFVLRKNLQR